MMRAVSGFIILLSGSVVCVCAAQTPSASAPSDRAGGAPTTAGPQTSDARPPIRFSKPRAAYQKLPDSSPAPQDAAIELQTAETDSDLQEVTVTARRSIPFRDRVRFYTDSTVYDTDGSSAMLYQNERVCADERLPIPKRMPDCDMAIWMTMHGGSVDDQSHASTLVARGLALQQTGDDIAAMKDLKAAVKIDPASPRPWLGIGRVYVARSDFQHAVEAYDRAMEIDPDDPIVYDNRGTALESLGQHAEAISDFSRAIALAPQDIDAYSNRATAYLAANRRDLAIADLDQVVRADPSNYLAYYNRGMAYELGGNLEKARIDYREASRRNPSFAPAPAALGRLDFGDPQSALEELTTAIRIDPKSAAVRTRALLYLSLDEPDRALPDLNQVIANDGSDAVAWADRGVAKSRLGDFAGAIGDCTRAIEIAPTTANYINRGNAFATLHRADEALADFNMGLQRDPNNIPALLGRANAKYMSRRLAASLDDYTRVIEADPRNALAYFKRGNIHFDRKEYASAFNDYSESLMLDPNQPAVLLNRANTAARLGRRSQAAKDEDRALQLDPYFPDGKR